MLIFVPYHYTIILPIHQVKTGKKITAHRSEPQVHQIRSALFVFLLFGFRFLRKFTILKFRLDKVIILCYNQRERRESYMSIFSERINGIMNQRQITQKQLAEIASVTESAMSHYVNGGRTPRIEVVRRLSVALGVTTDYLLGMDEPNTENESKLHFLQRSLAKLDAQQLEKAETLLKTVFEDAFTEVPVSSSDSIILEFYQNDGQGINAEPALKLYADIQEINTEGILFQDGSRIDFAECCRNYSGESKCVAARQMPYFVFFTSERPTKVIFTSTKSAFSRKNDRKSREDFRSLQIRLGELGYKTYDLS